VLGWIGSKRKATISALIALAAGCASMPVGASGGHNHHAEEIFSPTV
jgi:biotin transporter BioY